MKRSTGLKSQCTAITEEPLLAENREVLSTNEDLLLLLSHFSCVRLCDPIDSGLPGSSISGILQARTLECIAIYFSNA